MYGHAVFSLVVCAWQVLIKGVRVRCLFRRSGPLHDSRQTLSEMVDVLCARFLTVSAIDLRYRQVCCHRCEGFCSFDHQLWPECAGRVDESASSIFVNSQCYGFSELREIS